MDQRPRKLSLAALRISNSASKDWFKRRGRKIRGPQRESDMLRIHYADFFLRIAQNRLVNVPGCCDASCGAIRCFLKHMSCMSARPFPANFVRRRGLIESCPTMADSLCVETGRSSFRQHILNQ